MKYLMIILLSVLMFMIQGCEFFESEDRQSLSYFKINNLSQEVLTVYYALGAMDYGYPTLYPDTSLPENKVIFNDPYFRWAEKNLYDNMCASQIISKTAELNAMHNHTIDTLSVFIISADTLLKYGYDDVRENYRILVRYDLDWEEVKKLNYIFPYPPTPEMKGMKMYPSYQEVITQHNNTK